MKTLKLMLIILLTGMLNVTMNAQNVDEILSKHAEAIGGLDNWAKVKTMKMEMVMKMQGMEIPVTVTQSDCKAMRTDITVMGMTGYFILTDTSGWNFMPFQGQTKPEPLTKDIVKSAKDDLCFIDKLLQYKETGDNIEDLGKDDVDGTECFKLKRTNSIGIENTYFIDTETFLLIKKTTKTSVDGQVVESSSTMGDYKKLDSGIVIAMTTTQDGGRVTEMKNVTVNPDVDLSIFKVSQ
jgi:hypothetical protein